MEDRSRSSPRLADVALCLVGIAGIAAGITLLVLEGRALMDIGGFCAEGGPYVIAVHCPENSALIWMLGFLGGGAAICLTAWKSSAIGIGAWAVFFLAGGATFGAVGLAAILGALDPAGGEPGVDWGFVIFGVIFTATGILFFATPLLLGALTATLEGPDPDTPPGWRARRAIPGAVKVRTAAPPTTTPSAGGAPTAAETGAAEPAGAGDPLVTDLERLAQLHRDGALTDGEYARAKDDLLGHDEASDRGAAHDAPGSAGGAAR